MDGMVAAFELEVVARIAETSKVDSQKLNRSIIVSKAKICSSHLPIENI